MRDGSLRFSGISHPTLQPPLPLQEFFPLQPISLELQPPWPLQLFKPLQSCLFMAESDVAVVPELELEQPVRATVAPETSPAIAAEMIKVLAVRFIVLFSL
jgi:hypothetical protein